MVTESIDLRGADFDNNYATIEAPGIWQLGSDDITDELRPAVIALRNNPNAFITINVGTAYARASQSTLDGPYKTAGELLSARYDEVVRQLKEADPGVDTSRIKRNDQYRSNISFDIELSRPE